MAETQVIQQQPPEFIEAASKTYLDDLTKAIGTTKGLDYSQFMGPQYVAGPSAFTTQAEGLASGLGGYGQYLTSADALTGPSAYQSYMTPYQTDVISTTLDEYDRQTQKGIPALAANAINAGAYGGGREGIAQAEYASTAGKNRAALQAQLLNQGFTQANQLAGQDFLRNIQLAQQTPALLGQQMGALTTLGGAQEQRTQQGLTSAQQLAERSAFQPLTTAQAHGQGVMGLISGYPGTQQTNQTPTPGALQTGLSAGATLAGIYRLIQGNK